MEARFDGAVKGAGVTMFKTIRYTIAVNRALDGAVSRGVIREHKRKTMLDVCGSDENRELGVSALKTGAARSAPATAGQFRSSQWLGQLEHLTKKVAKDYPVVVPQSNLAYTDQLIEEDRDFKNR